MEPYARSRHRPLERHGYGGGFRSRTARRLLPLDHAARGFLLARAGWAPEHLVALRRGPSPVGYRRPHPARSRYDVRPDPLHRQGRSAQHPPSLSRLRHRASKLAVMLGGQFGSRTLFLLGTAGGLVAAVWQFPKYVEPPSTPTASNSCSPPSTPKPT